MNIRLRDLCIGGGIAFDLAIMHLIRQELSSCAPIRDTFGLVFGQNISAFAVLFILMLEYIIIPQIVSGFILSYFKRLLFNHTKSLTQSFKTICLIYVFANLALVPLVLFLYIQGVTSNTVTYTSTRLLKYIPSHPRAHILFLEYLATSTLLTFYLLVALLALEFSMSYILFSGQKTVEKFLRRNLAGIIPYIIVCFAYLGFYFHLEMLLRGILAADAGANIFVESRHIFCLMVATPSIMLYFLFVFVVGE
ncbi:hypothetical protein ENBRE01_0687 [Enteropsectra breve]|nr:hypothetical protein ENBRE01_0687 [Enteropsectra breve]